MIRHVLVPLDGSRLAERALASAARLAVEWRAQVTLLHVIERRPPGAVHGEPHLAAPESAQQYLADRAREAFPPEVEVTWHVHAAPAKDVARSIAAHAAHRAADLIAMCTHGRGGLRHRVFGSVAVAVAGLGPTAVLLVPAEGTDGLGWPCHRVLVASDGKPEHARGIPVAAAWAAAGGADLKLLWVVPTLGTLGGAQATSGQRLPGTMTALLEVERAQAAELARAALRDAGVEPSGSEVEIARGDPGREIVDAADRYGADLVVLATHGRTGLDAAVVGSVAHRVAGRARWPLLLVPAAPDRAAQPPSS